MGWIDDLQGQLIALDTAPLIYFIEEHPTYCPVVEPFFEQLEALLTNDIRWPSLPDLHILTLDNLV